MPRTKEKTIRWHGQAYVDTSLTMVVVVPGHNIDPITTIESILIPPPKVGIRDDMANAMNRGGTVFSCCKNCPLLEAEGDDQSGICTGFKLVPVNDEGGSAKARALVSGINIVDGVQMNKRNQTELLRANRAKCVIKSNRKPVRITVTGS